MKTVFYYFTLLCCICAIIAHPTHAEDDKKGEKDTDVKVEDEADNKSDKEEVITITTTGNNETEPLPDTVEVDGKEVPIDRADRTVTHRVTMEISFGREPIGNVTFGLFGIATPKTARNFFVLSDPRRRAGEGYKGSKLHRVVRGFAVQGGDFIQNDGSGGWSIYGRYFKDENFDMKHFPFCLAMANSGKDTNASQFYVTLIKTSWLDGKHVVFGQVEKGHKIIKAVNEVRVNRFNRPWRDVWISNTWSEEVDHEAHEEL